MPSYNNWLFIQNKSSKTIETVSSFGSMKFLRKQKTTLCELKIHINSLQSLTQTQNLRKI